MVAGPRPTLRKRRRVLRMTGWILFGVFVAPALISVVFRIFAERPHWGAASHQATGQAPAAETFEPVVQVYAARTWGMRGAVAVHTWIAAKRSGAETYLRYEVIGWRLRRTGSALVREPGKPDAMWFSNHPKLLTDLRGPGMDAVIDKIEAAVRDYPYAGEYRMWPGPNSNTFTAFVGRRVPELGLNLPPTAIGKDYLANGALIGPAPSGTGVQLSIRGMVGVTAALREGVEVNLLGAAAGVGLYPPAVRLPGLGSWPSWPVQVKTTSPDAPAERGRS